MEISSNRLSPYNPAQQQTGRAGTAAPFNQTAQAEQGGDKRPGELLPATQAAQQGDKAQLDYRQLVLQARRQQLEARQQEPSGGKAYRMGGEPLKVQQALGAYRDTAELQAPGAELMPRLDDYV